jgi:hypothetical protein
MVWMAGRGFHFQTIHEAREYVSGKEVNEFKINVRLGGFKPAGTKAFDVHADMTIQFEQYRYVIGLGYQIDPNNVIAESLYHEVMGSDQRQVIIDRFMEGVLDGIETNLNRIVEVGNH